MSTNEISAQGREIARIISAEVESLDFITSAIVYGSSLYAERSADIDVAVMIPSDRGVVETSLYEDLLSTRTNLSTATGRDVDLVPHTTDELDDPTSPIWYPRYNPSLCAGVPLKGGFRVVTSSLVDVSFGFQDLARYVMYDNRTVCRRQLLRSLKGEEGRIFVSKLRHGPGGALTYDACRRKTPYLAQPSDTETSFQVFDNIHGTDSTKALLFLRSHRWSVDLMAGLKLMRWYESLVRLVFHEAEYTAQYQEACCSFSE